MQSGDSPERFALSIHMLWKAVAAVAAVVIVASVLPGPFAEVKKAGKGNLLLGSKLDESSKTLLRRGCLNCHSQETEWPWYSHVAPMSWLLERDVQQARMFMNFSRWDEYGPAGQSQLLQAAVARLDAGTMPPGRYLTLHPEGHFSAEERTTLKAALNEEIKRLQNTPVSGEAK